MLTKSVCTACRVLAEITVVFCISAITQVRTGVCVDATTLSCSFLRLVDCAVFNLCIRSAGWAPFRRTDCCLALVAECWTADLPNLRVSIVYINKQDLNLVCWYASPNYVTFLPEVIQSAPSFRDLIHHLTGSHISIPFFEGSKVSNVPLRFLKDFQGFLLTPGVS